jgi:polyisoprenoid-binding protein YceI
MKKITIALAALLMGTASFAQTAWKSDKMHSKLTFSITHLGVSDVAGLFNNFDVTATTNKADFSDAVFELTAETNSINTEVEMRDKHLKSADFFEVEKYPNMTFKSTSIKKTTANHYLLSGTLTLHGVTKPVNLNLWYRGTVENPMSKKPTAGFQLTGSIKRSDFAIGAKFPEPMLSDVVMIKADGEFGQ